MRVLLVVAMLLASAAGCMEEKPFPRPTQEPGTVSTQSIPTGPTSAQGGGFHLVLAEDEAAGRLVVEEAGADADWSRVEVRSSDGSVRFAVNEDAGPASRPVEYDDTWVTVRDSADDIATGDFVDFCAEREARQDVAVDVRVAGGDPVGSFGFPTLGAC